MAEAAVVGAAAAIEGRYGVLTSFTAKPLPKWLTEKLGKQWVLLQIAIKPYPSCRLTHAAIDAALDLRRRFGAADLPRAAIKVAISPVAMKIVGERSPAKLAPRDTVDAQFSIYCQLAAAWLDGKLEWSSYERLGADDIEALAQRMSVEVDPDMRKAGVSFAVALDDTTLSQTVEDPLGEPERPLGWEGLKAKFLSLAEPVYGAARAAEIADVIGTMGPATRMAAVTGLLRTDDANA